ncbi:MAG: hypothetical protein J1D77_02255 [Muribaculaceae bacterium]|nr:hypothetical protein [Muribaculaceae bacterium]
MNRLEKILRKLFLPVFLLMVAAGLEGCQDELIFPEDDVARQDNLPVEFNINIEGLSTRGPQYFKTEFETNEVVHVQGTFRLSDGDVTVKYGAFRFNGEKWEQYGGATGTADVPRFSWPNNTIEADFTAYYVYGSNSLMVPTDNPDNDITPVTFSSITGTSVSNPDHDPLKATTKNMKYGHTINLEFYHACAYLTIEEMQPISNVFWFTQELTDGSAPESFKNAFRLYLGTDNQLHFDFLQVENPEYGDKVYIQGLTTTAMIDNTLKASAGFFLAPGQYTNFVVGYPGSTEMINYISYTKAESPTQPGEPDPGDNGEIEPDEPGEGPLNPNNELAENGVYIFNVTKSNGVEIVNPLVPEEWDEGDDPIYDVDAEQFLWSICNNLEYYSSDGTLLLRPEGNVSHLLHNVNIQWAEYDIFPPSETNNFSWWEPILSQGVTFDGGLHYIWNLASPLFRKVDGVVRRVGLSNAKMNVLSKYQYTPTIDDPEEGGEPDAPVAGPAPGVYEMNRQGALCCYLDKGTIEQIRVKTQMPNFTTTGYFEDIFQMNVEVWGESSQESHSIGGLIGSNNEGTINDITIFCDIEMNLSNYDIENNEIPRVYIGGIIGQNLNIMHNISSGTGSNSMLITNFLNFDEASYSIGGCVGLFGGGTINDVYLPNVNIDSRRSLGSTSFIGGLAGRLSNVDNGGQLLNCRIENGSVYAGKCVPDLEEEQNGSAVTGGIAGDIYESYEINECFVSVNVYGPYNNPQQGYDNYINDGTVDYSTGGMFGNINNIPGQSPTKIINNGAYGTVLRGPTKYIGNFAGTVPSGETWEADYAPNGNEVVPHTYVDGGASMPNIGNQP